MDNGTGTVEVRKIMFAKPVETIGWPGMRARGSVDDSVAKIELDFAARIWRCTPVRGDIVEGPFENLTGWKRKVEGAEKTPEPIDGDKEPEKAWTRKPPNQKMRKPRTAAAPAPDPVVPTATL